MSIVIVGGNKCMVRRYLDLCRAYRCPASVYTKPRGGLKSKLGSPDQMIVFTSAMSHKMLQGALCAIQGKDTKVEYCHSASVSALKTVLDKHTA